MKVLFVDDEERVLSGLRRMLRDKRSSWEMSFCQRVEEALALVHREPLDVVVSDMRMPQMDGASFLAEVRRIQPDSVRIILSGEADAHAIFRSMSVTHRYLDKPCDPQALKDAIELARNGAQSLVADEAVARVLLGVDRLPSLPALRQQVIAALDSPDSSAAGIGELIERDVAMSAKLLQIVNSTAFGLPHAVEETGKAVALLGVDRVKELLLAADVLSDVDGGPSSEQLHSIWKHSARTLALAKKFAESLDQPDETLGAACSAAMLHECGRLILAGNFQQRYAECVERAGREGIPLARAEVEEFGVEHGRIGAFVLSLWGLPQNIVQSVAYHAWPSQAGEETSLTLALVHAACALARDPQNENLDMECLRRHGLDERLAGWRSVAGLPAEEAR